MILLAYNQYEHQVCLGRYWSISISKAILVRTRQCSHLPTSQVGFYSVYILYLLLMISANISSTGCYEYWVLSCIMYSYSLRPAAVRLAVGFYRLQIRTAIHSKPLSVVSTWPSLQVYTWGITMLIHSPQNALLTSFSPVFCSNFLQRPSPNRLLQVDISKVATFPRAIHGDYQTQNVLWDPGHRNPRQSEHATLNVAV